MGIVSNMKAKLAKKHNHNSKKGNEIKRNRMKSVHRNMKNSRNSGRFGNLKNTRNNRKTLGNRPSTSPPPPPKKPSYCKFAYAAKNDPLCKVGGKRKRRRKTKRRRTKRRRRTRRRRRR